MTNIQYKQSKRNFHREMILLMLKVENPFAKALKQIISKQYKSAASYVSQGLPRYIIHAVNEQSIPLASTLLRYYKIAGVSSAKKAISSLPKMTGAYEQKAIMDTFMLLYNQWMQTQAGQKVQQVQETTKASIRRIVEAGLNDGQGYADIARNILAVDEIASLSRATRIARTEGHTAITRAFDGAMEATGFDMEKEWSATMDMRTRAAHITADGDRVGMNDLFFVDGEFLRFPGDPLGGPGNIINCRCVCLYHMV